MILAGSLTPRSFVLDQVCEADGLKESDVGVGYGWTFGYKPDVTISSRSNQCYAS